MCRALAWVGERTAEDLALLWVIEGIGSYGGQLAHAVESTGYAVVEAAHMPKRNSSGLGKNDAIETHRMPLPCCRSPLTSSTDPETTAVFKRL
ncbi:hypothetical protein A6F49_03120 [Enteractinococcus helveticum]|uniref:Uncharacterized protein n=2 Tax=Enteractinococcus helveticum TaxID=1837282 RepID=A0A1B7M397_9MICC|nr:hypothetical protein A6F49_03120 [Enteractinococcus helveticum]